MKVFTVGQLVLLDFLGSNYTLTVTQTVINEQSEVETSRGMLFNGTSFFFESSPSSGIKVRKISINAIMV